MPLNLLFLISLVVVAIAHNHLEHECIHDSLPKSGPVRSNQNIDFAAVARKRNAQQTTFTKPLTMLFNYDNLDDDSQTCYKAGQQINLRNYGVYTCTSADVKTEEKEAYLKQIVEAGSKIWTGALAVVPPATLDASGGCPMYNADLKDPPPNYVAITDANFVLYVTMRPIPGGKVIAYAVPCLLDQINRPVIGYANFNPSRLVMNDPLIYKQQLSVVSHELAHALGFSSAGMNQFVTWVDDPLPGASPVNFLQRSDVQKYNSTSNTTYLITPAVVKAAQTHFNCNRTRVAVLEARGGPATAGSHWGMKQFYNELLTGITTAFPVYSPMTFAYFEDSGWYGIYNRSNIETLVWGKKRGCSFIDDCGQWPLSTPDDPGYRCNEPTGDATLAPEECTFDLKSQGKCSNTKTTYNALIDDCRYIYTPEDSRCDNPVNTFLFHNNVGELVGKTSRCFRSNILKLTRQFTVQTVPGAFLTQCYNTTCKSKTQLAVGVDSIWYDCPYAGGEVGVVGYGGTIKCIPYAADRICPDAGDDTADWPIVSYVEPNVTVPSSVITIYGSNFLKTDKMSVLVIRGDRSACSNVVVLNDNSLNCTLPDNSGFSTLTDVAKSLAGPVAVTIVVTDAKGRTDVAQDKFSVWVNSELAIQSFFTKYPHWTVLIAIVLFLILIGIIVAIAKFAGCNPLDGVNDVFVQWKGQATARV